MANSTNQSPCLPNRVRITGVPPSSRIVMKRLLAILSLLLFTGSGLAAQEEWPAYLSGNYSNENGFHPIGYLFTGGKISFSPPLVPSPCIPPNAVTLSLNGGPRVAMGIVDAGETLNISIPNDPALLGLGLKGEAWNMHGTDPCSSRSWVIDCPG